MLLKRRSLLGLVTGTALAGRLSGGSPALGDTASRVPPGGSDRDAQADRARPPGTAASRAGVLVLGATGFIGARLVHALAAQGVELAAASRRGEGLHGVALDRRDPDRVRALVRERRLGTIVDLLAYTEAETLPLLTALDGEVERWVMASSGDVYRNYEGLVRKAAPTPITAPLTEDSPLRSNLYLHRQQPRRDPTESDAYLDDYDKIPLEDALRARSGLSGTVMRLPMVYGPGDRQRRFRDIVEPMLAGHDRVTVDPGLARWRTSYGYVDDVADAIATAALHPAAAGRTFNLGEAETLDHRGWMDRFATTVGWSGTIVEVRADDGAASALDLTYPLAMETSAFRTACGWREPTATAEAVARTAADEKRRG